MANKKDALDKVPTPLEAIDAAADMVNQIARTPLRVVRNVANAVGTMAGNLERDVATPAESSETPPPPDKLIKPAMDGVGHIFSGVMDVVKGAVDGVTETGRGVQREADQFIK